MFTNWKNWGAQVVVFSFLIIPNSFAADDAFHKLGRGITNVVTAPVEIPKEIRAHWIKGSEKTFHILVWIFCGVIKGAVMSTARIGSGAWDIVSAPVALPKGYQPILKPEYVFDDWPKRVDGVDYKNLGEE